MKITILKNTVLGDIDCSAIIEFDDKQRANNFCTYLYLKTGKDAKALYNTVKVYNINEDEKKLIINFKKFIEYNG